MVGEEQRTLQITAPHFCAAVVLNRHGEACRAAPILFYMANADWTEERIRNYCRNKAWAVAEVCCDG